MVMEAAQRLLVEQKQLWLVSDKDDHWLWFGRGTQEEAIEGAKESPEYNPDATLYLYAIAAQILVEPIAVKG